MNCQDCYWYNPQADGSGCILGREVPQDDCPDVYEDWELLAEVSPTDPRLHERGIRVPAGEWRRSGAAGVEYEVGDDSRRD